MISIGKSIRAHVIACALFLSLFILNPAPVEAASCCGGGSGASLTLPKFAQFMLSFSIDHEKYNGYWDGSGVYFEDPPGSDLRQLRINSGAAIRLGDHWQASLVAPFIANINRYSGVQSNTSSMGDITLGFYYEAFDSIKCVWKVRSIEDLMPAIYLGGSLTLPTGVSPYGEYQNSFDITGLGFYRSDARVMIDKTVYPFNLSLAATYGVHFERPINREYDLYVKPYTKQLGNPFSVSATFGYTLSLDSMDSLTAAISYSHVSQGPGKVNSIEETLSSFENNIFAASLSYSSADQSKVVRLNYSTGITTDGLGKNRPVTNIIRLEVWNVFF